jgi:hypothetical protein
LRVTTVPFGDENDVSMVGEGSVWIAAESSPYVARRLADGGVASPTSALCARSFYSAAAGAHGTVYLGGVGEVRRLDNSAGACSLVSSTGANAPVSSLWAVPSDGGHLVYAASINGYVSYLGDGTSFNRANDRPADALYAIEGFSPSSIFAAGSGGAGVDRGAIYFFDGSNWSSSFQSGVNATQLRALSFVSPTLGWSGGARTNLLKWDGTTWLPDVPRPPQMTVVLGLKAFSADAIYAIGDAPEIMKWNGTTWIQVGTAVGVTNQLAAIRGSSECDLWVVGHGGYVATTNH